MLKKQLFFWLLAVVFAQSVYAAGIDTNTSEFLDNYASNNKPYKVEVKTSWWENLLESLFTGKSDFTQKAKLSNTTLNKDTNTSFTDWLSAIFHKSSSEKSGYYNSILPNDKRVSSSGGLGENTKSVKQALLPYNVSQTEIGAETAEITSGTATVSEGDGEIIEAGAAEAESVEEIAATDSVLKAAEDIFNAAGKNCGWRTNNSQTKPLVTTIGSDFTNVSMKDKVKISCLASVVPSTAYSYLKRSADGIHWLQCVGFVNGATALAGKTIVQSGNANSYCKGSFSGYKKYPGTNAKAGDVAVNTSGAVGHIFVVKEVKGTRVLKVEANYHSGTIENKNITDTKNIACVWRKM